MAWPTQTNPGLFVPTTEVWDVERLREVSVTSPEFKELLVRLYQNINTIALALNKKDSALYSYEEFVNGQVFPSTTPTVGDPSIDGRQVFRKVIQFGQLPRKALKSVPHGIELTATTSFTRIYGCTTGPSTTIPGTYAALPLPFANPNALQDNISLAIVGPELRIRTGCDRDNFINTWVIIEYLKS